jgi:hypothetical protein
VLEPLAAQQRQLILRERGIDVHKRDAVKRHVPCSEPRVFPRVGHRHHIEGLEATPSGVAPEVPCPLEAAVGRCRRRATVPRRSSRTAYSTACRRTPGRITSGFVGRCCGRCELRVERVSLGAALAAVRVKSVPQANADLARRRPDAGAAVTRPSRRERPKPGTRQHTCCPAAAG